MLPRKKKKLIDEFLQETEWVTRCELILEKVNYTMKFIICYCDAQVLNAQQFITRC